LEGVSVAGNTLGGALYVCTLIATKAEFHAPVASRLLHLRLEPGFTSHFRLPVSERHGQKQSSKTSAKKLLAFHDKIASMRIFDPA